MKGKSMRSCSSGLVTRGAACLGYKDVIGGQDGMQLKTVARGVWFIVLLSVTW